MEKQKLRSEIDKKDTWDLTPIFKTKKDFLKSFKEVKAEISKFDKYKGKITKNAKDLYNFLVFSDEFERKIYKLYYYAHLSYDADTTNAENQKLHDMIDNLSSLYDIKTSFITPELYEIEYSKILEYIKNHENKSGEKEDKNTGNNDKDESNENLIVNNQIKSSNLNDIINKNLNSVKKTNYNVKENINI